MKSIDNIMKGNERIIYRAKHHWAVLLGPMLVILFGWLMLGSKGPQVFVLIAFGLIWGILSYVSLQRSEIVLLENRLLINVGFPLKRSYDIPLAEISYIDFYQPSLGSILNFGKIIMVHSGKKKSAFRFVDSPALLVKEVQGQIIAVRDLGKPKQSKKK